MKSKFCLLAALLLGIGASPASSSAINAPQTDSDALIQPFERDVFVIDGVTLRNPTADTTDDAPLFNVAGVGLGVGVGLGDGVGVGNGSMSTRTVEGSIASTCHAWRHRHSNAMARCSSCRSLSATTSTPWWASNAMPASPSASAT